MDTANLVFGLVGAMITVVAFKQKAIPEFRPLYDVNGERAELLTVEDQVKAVSAESVKTPSAERTELLKALQDQANRLRTKIQRNELLARGLGLIFYVILGGLVAGLFTDDIEIEGLGNVPKALLIGSAWTSYLTALGFRSEVTAREDLEQSIEGTHEKLAEVLPEVQAAVASAAEANASAPEAAEAPEQVEELLNSVKGQVAEDLAKIRAAQLS